MRRKLLVIPLLIALLMPLRANATECVEPQLIRCTCYTSDEGAITASGEKVREGIVAGKSEWSGCACIIYDQNMNLIGIYEVLDTGGDYIKSGNCIDVYKNTLDECYDWVNEYGDYVYIQIIPAVG